MKRKRALKAYSLAPVETAIAHREDRAREGGTMLDIVLPIAVLAMLLLFVDQVRRLISLAILNHTIRKALELDPHSVPLLIARMEPRSRWPDALAGWIMLLGGIALAVAGAFEGSSARSETFEVAAVAAILGIGVLAYSWFVTRATPRQ